MKSLIRIGLIRLYKNSIYVGGCILATVITYWFLAAGPIPQLAKYDAENVAVLLSAAMAFFFSFFVGLFMGREKEDGIFRNKIIAGHSRFEVYFGYYIVLIIAYAVMTVFWLAGAFMGGARFTNEFVMRIGIGFLCNSVYIFVIQTICFKIGRLVTGTVISIGLFYLLVNAVLFGNFFYMLADGNTVAENVVVFVYNLSALGQTFAGSGLADEELSNPAIQITASLAVLAVTMMVGTFRLGKKDIN